ncbi:MAG: CpaE family protein [Desulfovibrionaceae bacterium]
MRSETIQVTLAMRDQESTRLMRELLADEAGVAVSGASGGVARGLVFFEPGGDLAQDVAVVERMLAMAGVDEVFLVSTDRSPDLLVAAMRAGVKECLPLPPAPEELRHALARFDSRRALARGMRGAGVANGRTPAPDQCGGVIHVVGCKGGVGATTLAVNLAVELQALANPPVKGATGAAGAGSSVALVDMNPSFGEIPLFLDIEPRRDWGEMLRNLDRLDATYLLSGMARHASGVHVLPGPARHGDDNAPSDEGLERLFALLRENFAYVVVDGGGFLDETACAVMGQASRVLLVGELGLPSLANMQKWDAAVQGLASVSGDAVRVVFNRYLSSSEISVQDAEEILGRKAFWLVHNDYAAAMSAINLGKPLREAAPKSRATREVAAMAGALASGRRPVPAKERSGLFGLSLFRKPAAAQP